MLSFIHQPFAIVDIETTGTSASEARITEIAVLYDEDDELKEWCSLCDPGISIPPYITQLTGITDDMVIGQPTFAELAPDLHNLLNERLFIAHNAPFDFGFLSAAFMRDLGVVLESKQLCTVRLARKLFPEEHKHNLDALTRRFGLKAKERHRAMADAQLVWQLLQAFEDRQAPAYLTQVVDSMLNAKKRTRTLKSTAERLPKWLRED